MSTIGLAAKFEYWGVEKGFFDVLVVDEAGYATEPEVVAVAATLIEFFPACNSKSPGQLVLAGDPKQLGPVITSHLCQKLGLGLSYMERLTKRPIYQPDNNGTFPASLITMLVRNYRSHPSILYLPNNLFYGGTLVTSGDRLSTHSLANWEHLPKRGFPVLFHSLEGENLRESNSPSWFNPQEALQIATYVRLLLFETKPPLRAEEIGIITPYAKQAQKIRELLAKQGVSRDLKIGSVEMFQGQERRCILVSTVRSNPSEVSRDIRYNLGFVSHPKRFNVTITRAKCLLIVVGCARLLALDRETWLPFLRYCHSNGSWCGDDWDTNDALELENHELLEDGEDTVVDATGTMSEMAISTQQTEE